MAIIITLANNFDNTLLSIGDGIVSHPVVNGYTDTLNGNFCGYVTAIGPAGALTANQIETNGTTAPGVNDFLFVVKNQTAESAGVKGTYVTARFINNSPISGLDERFRPSLFEIGAQVIESSK
jgi:hypothetical protein|tara:strand:- start:2680 stop:3048 length:369 start_codon:yes stop_codon:yes gene_type:complete